MPFNFKNILFMDVPQKVVSLENIKNIVSDKGAKRINFASTHATALSSYKKEWKIKLPFRDSVLPLIKKEIRTDISLFDSKFEGGVWRSITNDEYSYWNNFISCYKDVVFLRDTLDISLSLSMNIIDDESRTEIGELEYQAKYHKNSDAEKSLVALCADWINKLPYYKDADLICAVPSSTPNNLPQRIVEKLSITAKNISTDISWTSKTRAVKDAENIDDKISILEESGLDIKNIPQLKGKIVILFDDLYMSGVTLQYIAMKLKEAGAQRVLGLTIVKSRSNSTI